MGYFDNKIEYLEEIKNQIRCKKARAMVAEEIEHHIEDQAAYYLQEGDEEDVALKKALEQMGDPVVVGKQLDKIHRPKMEWRILLIVLALCGMGILAQISLVNMTREMDFYITINSGKHLIFLGIGIIAMFAVYFFDYTILGRYPKIIWLVLIAFIYIYAPFGTVVNGRLFYLHAYSQLLLPVYGAVLYAYRKTGYKGVIKCILIAAVTGVSVMKYTAQASVYLAIFISTLIMLSVAIVKDWFGKDKKISLLMVWGCTPMLLILVVVSSAIPFTSYYIERFKVRLDVLLHPELSDFGYQMSIVRQIISNSKLIGSTVKKDTIILPGIDNDFILTYIISKWGIVAGCILILLFFILIGRMISITLHYNNPLGRYVGLGCSLVFGIQGLIYILANLGIQLVTQVNLPFVSYGGSGLLVNFMVLGLMLSVFRNKDIAKEVPYKQKLALRLEKIK